ncbi:MAG: hypothetical protein ACREOJ_09455 [Gemmatimonadaceae bacterium]
MLMPHAEIHVARREAGCVDLIRKHDAPLVMLELSSRTVAEGVRITRSIKSALPLLPVVGFATWNQDSAVAFMPLARAGISDVVLDAPGAKGRLLELMDGAGMGKLRQADMMYVTIAPHIPATLAGFVRVGLQVVPGTQSVEEMATRMGTYRQKLDAMLRDAGGPSLGEFRQWCLLFWIGYYFDNSALSIEHIALELGIGSGSTISHKVKEYTLLKAGDVRKRGALGFLAALFARECEKQRPAPNCAKNPGKPPHQAAGAK